MKTYHRILIFGNGQMGNFYRKLFLAKNLKAEISGADITNSDQILDAVNTFKPTIIINTAAKTNLEWCTGNKLSAFNANVLGPDNLAKICDENQIYFIHLSSGCIMESKNGSDIKKEDDSPNPISYYSWTKWWAENLITFHRSKNFKYLILRPRQPVSAEINYKNMLIKFLTFTRFIENPNSGTIIEDFMEWSWELINQNSTGVFNVANEGWVTPYEIGALLKKYVLPSLPLIKITKAELNKLTPETRVDTVLDVTKLKHRVSSVRSYKEGLEDTIKKLAKNFQTTDPKIIREQMEKAVAQSKTRTIVNDVWPQLIPSNP